MSEEISAGKNSMFGIRNLKEVVVWSATVAFVCLAFANIKGIALVPNILGAICIMIAGGALFWSEKDKVGLVMAAAGLLNLFWNDVPGVAEWILIALYAGVVFYFKATKLNRTVIVYCGILAVLHLVWRLLEILDVTSCRFALGGLIALLQLAVAACFISRRYLMIERIILQCNEWCVSAWREECAAVSKRVKKFKGETKTGGGSPDGVVSSGQITLEPQILSTGIGYRFCKFYAYSTFVVGLTCCVVLLFWASPVKLVSEVPSWGGEITRCSEETPWNQYLITSAVFQLVGCTLWGLFILSQISCAVKLRGQRIVAGTAPVCLLVVRYLSLLLAAVCSVGVLLLHFDESGNDWAIWLTFTDMSSLLSISSHCEIKTAVTLSSIAFVWHLLGIANVSALLRDNSAKVMSLGSKTI